MITNSRGVLILIFLWCGVSNSQSFGEVKKIMPLGNSITSGKSTKTCYRYYLDELLKDNGYEFDFVGSLKKHGNEGVAVTISGFDYNHEGHWGRSTGWTLPRIGGYARAARPDIVMIHLGTNNFWSSISGTNEKVTKNAVADMDDIIDTLRSINPNVQILLAQMIPTKNKGVAWDRISLYNEKLLTFATAKTTEKSPILVVDQWTGYLTGDFIDDCHPNQSGAKKMADKWFAGYKLITAQTGIHNHSIVKKGTIGFSGSCNIIIYDRKGYTALINEDRELLNGFSVYSLRGKLLWEYSKKDGSAVRVPEFLQKGNLRMLIIRKNR